MSRILALILVIVVAGPVMGEISVRDRGARGDGATDDTAAINRAIAESPRGGVVYFPVGTYRVSAPIVVNRAVTLRGEGVDAYYQGRFGDPTYGSDFDIDSGAIVESTATRGAIVQHTPENWATVRVDTLHLKGVGGNEREIVGLKVGSSKFGGFTTIRSLRVSNCKVGVEFEGVQGSTVDDVWAHGCDVGLFLKQSTTADTFTNYSASGCGDGIVTDGATCTFIGGQIQSSLRSGIVVRGEENTFRGIYLESQDSPLAIDVVRPGGDCTVIDTCHYGGWVGEGGRDGVRIAAASCKLFAGKSARTLEITPTGYGTVVVGNWSGAVVDHGYRTEYVGLQLNLPPRPPPPRGVATIPVGRTWILVPHGMPSAPDLSDISLTAIGGLGRASYPVVYGANATQIQIGLDRDPGSAGAKIGWSITPR